MIDTVRKADNIPRLEARGFPAPLAAGLAKEHLPSLDGVRAIAAFLVVFFHAGLPLPGSLGVLAFFVLSGFLITWLLLREEERYGAVSLKQFYVRRSLRIFPAFYVYWLVVVGTLLLLHKRLVIAQAICSFFYLNDYYQAIFGDPNTGLSHTWSLGVEEQFYLIWPVVFILLGANRRRIRFLAWAIAATVAYRETLVFVFRLHQGYTYEAFDARADHLMIGCLLAVVLRERAALGVWQRICVSPVLVWVTVALLCVSGALTVAYGANYRDTLGSVADPILVAILLVQTITWPAEGVGAALNWRWMRYLGAISYSIYLYQQIVVGEMEKVARPWPWLRLPVIVAGVIAAASFSYWVVERPALSLRGRFGRPRHAVV